MGSIIKFENRKYSEEDFVIPAQDTKGHSERLWCRVQPGYARELRAILESKRFPFRTQGDILRAAVKLMVDMLHKMEPGIVTVVGQVGAITKIVRDEQYHQEFVAVFEEVDKVVSRYIGSGDEGQARRMLLTIMEQIRQMPEGYWQEKYRKEIDKKFGHLIRNSGVNLSTEGTDEDDDDDGKRRKKGAKDNSNE